MVRGFPLADDDGRGRKVRALVSLCLDGVEPAPAKRHVMDQ